MSGPQPMSLTVSARGNLDTKKKRVIVLGAGLAGLRGALHLLEEGYDVEVLEKLDGVGGMARSHDVDGFTFDHGPHGFFSREQWLADEFKEVVGGEDQVRHLTKWSQIYYRSEYFNYPLKMRDLASKMSPFKLLHTFFSYLWSRIKLKITRRKPANAEEYLVDQFGRVLYEEFFGPYTKKVWAVDTKEFDADFMRDRVPSLHLWDVIRKFFSNPAKEQRKAMLTPSGRIAAHDLHSFYYPKGGARALPDGYARKIRELGGRIRLNAKVERIDRHARVVHGTADGEAFELPYEGMLSTIPVDVLTGLLDTPDEMAALAATLRYRGILLVNLCVAKPQVIGPFWIYYTDRVFNRISEYRHFSPDLVPDGMTGICLEVGANRGELLWNADDGDIVRYCLPDLENLGLLREDEIKNHLVIREANAYPIYDVGCKPRINSLVNWIEHTAGIMTAGRQGRFLYLNQDTAILSGIDAAKAIHQFLSTGTVQEREVWSVAPGSKIKS